MKTLLSILASLISLNYAFAEPVEDNSFLMEEAYNQEPGVVQFINSYQYFKKSKDWNYLFTNEIPIGGQTHQFSYTIPYSRVDSLQSTGIGDILLNYRYQLVNKGDIAMAPRLSLIVPSGKYQDGLGQGAYGLQFNHAVSIKVTDKFVNHWNIGATWIPDAKNQTGNKATTTSLNYGASVIYLITDSFNFMTEVVGTSSESTSGENQTARSDTFFILPGIRYAIDTANWQIVPGIGIPMGLGPSGGEGGVLVYLSIEGKMF